ncbi:MAG: DUF1924 domain-containing protein [Deltaproteobacteria bacterium]|nr:DUF1924 domain-containing protein [Deltaproteobacteria bacterium]
MSEHDPSSTKVRVWDIPVRVFHWMLGLLVLGAFLTGENDDRVSTHVSLGAATWGLVVFRVAWGFLGSGPARFRSFVRSPREVFDYARALWRRRPPPHLGHNPLGGAMVLTLLGLLLAIIVSGIAMKLGPEWEGPLSPYMSKSLAHGIEELHEGLTGALLVLVALHVLGVIVSSLVEGQNLVLGMFTGKKRATHEASTEASVETRGRALGFALSMLLGLGVAGTLRLVLGSRTAEASETPSSLLSSYVAAARTTRSDFSPSAERGRELYFATYAATDGKTSCATCHTDDPTAKGKSPAGKVIDPLSPTVSPDRFTDRAKADKWFDRNCKQVVGRPCSPAEKADFITWVLGR